MAARLRWQLMSTARKPVVWERCR